MKVLVIRFSSIGDIVLTTPVVRCLKKQQPDTEVHFLTKFSMHKVVASNPYIDKFYYLQDNWDLLLHELKDENYDCIIDLHHNLRTLKIKKALRVQSYSFNKLNIQKWLLTNFKINRMPDLHIVDRYMETLKAFSVQNDGRGLDYFIPKDEEISEHDLPYAQSAGYVGLVIGGAHATKRLPVEKLSTLCSQIEHPIVLLGGPEDRSNGDLIAAIDPVKIYNSCGKYALNESADLVRKAKLIITHDTGLMHIAAAFKKPIISIWGNTVPAFGMTPYYGDANTPHRVFEVKKLGCRPCSKIGYDQCPRKHFKCMNNIDVTALAAQAMNMLRNL